LPRHFQLPTTSDIEPGPKTCAVVDAVGIFDAQEAVERHARQTSTQAREAHQSQPFLTGAIVAGIGALIGALLPSTKAEADMMGATRDKMMRDAEAVMREELGKLEQQGKSAVETGIKEARSEFADARHSA